MANSKNQSSNSLKMDYPVNSKEISEAIKKGKLGLILGHPTGKDEKKLIADYNRFSARYRMAKSFNGINLLRYDKSTMDAYSALMRVFLAYTAFELFLEIFPQRHKDDDENLYLLLLDVFKRDSEIKRISNKIIKYSETNSNRSASKNSKEKKDTLLSAIQNNLDFTKHPSNKKRLDIFLSKKGEYYKKVLISAAIVRHKFAHGHLTANINNSSTKKTIEISKLIVESLLFRIMDDQFSKLIFNNI